MSESVNDTGIFGHLGDGIGWPSAVVMCTRCVPVDARSSWRLAGGNLCELFPRVAHQLDPPPEMERVAESLGLHASDLLDLAVPRPDD